MIRIGFTGTQQGMTAAQECRLVELLSEFEHDAVEIHHGDCIGADEEAHGIAENFMFDIVIHPPDIDAKRAFCHAPVIRDPRPYLERNKDIVDETEVLIACPNGDEKLRSGTWSTVRWARKRMSQGDFGTKKLYIITPSGDLKREGR